MNEANVQMAMARRDQPQTMALDAVGRKAAIDRFRAFLSLEQDRIFRKQIEPRLLITNKCWIFEGFKDKKGYGSLRIGGRNGRTVKVHKWMWEAINGPMWNGKVSDHLCCTPSCCNPWHIEAVTPKENTRRSPITRASINAKRTHCPNGHPYTPENTRVTYGRRRCRICIREARRLKLIYLRNTRIV